MAAEHWGEYADYTRPLSNEWVCSCDGECCKHELMRPGETDCRFGEEPERQDDVTPVP